jgi:hypothetical protein
MVKMNITCPDCGQSFQCGERDRGHKIKCAHCRQVILVPPISLSREIFWKRLVAIRKILLVACVLVLVAATVVVGMGIVVPVSIHWADRRPIGALFLASHSAASPTNPRGWFNDPGLDVTGTNGPQRFRKALLEYTDRSLAILKRTKAQGVIVWDLEGEQFPQKTSYIGDPRLLDRLAPEMASVADEFFGRLRSAGLRIGLTVRPQQLVFDDDGQPRQTQVINLKRSLLDKIDYARARWGATIFYIDSNSGIRRPDEVWQLRRLAEQRPDILLIPEHHYQSYRAFSAPYVSLRKGDSTATARRARKLFPGSFEVLDIGDVPNDRIIAARLQGDILLFRAWFWSPECQLLEGFANRGPEDNPR